MCPFITVGVSGAGMASDAGDTDPVIPKQIARYLRQGFQDPKLSNEQVARSIVELNRIESLMLAGRAARMGYHFGQNQQSVEVDMSIFSINCDPALGMRRSGNCLSVACEVNNLADTVIEFNPGDPPRFIHYGKTLAKCNVRKQFSCQNTDDLSGDCVIAVGFKGKTSIAGSALISVVDYLLEKCSRFPMALQVWGTAVSTPLKGCKSRAKRGKPQSFIPYSI